MQELSVAELAARVGQEVGVSPWHAVDQAMIDAFAALTGDDQFIHTDPGRARRETSLGGTVAHGFLTLSLLGAMAREAQPVLRGVRMSLNYGFDRVRFVSPVPAGARVRGRFVLASLEETRPEEVTVTWNVTVEIEGRSRPALIADWISRRYLATTADASVGGEAEI